MKKFFALIAVLALCLGCFAGCGDKAADPEPTASTGPVSEVQGTDEEQADETETTLFASDGKETALTIDGQEYSLAICNIYFAGIYYDFLNTYGDYASMFGLDVSSGMSNLKEQACDYSEDGTWHGYFMESAVAMMTQVQALVSYAKANNIEVPEDQKNSIEALFADLDSMAAENDFDDGDAYLAAVYGAGVDQELYREYLENNALADAAYEAFYENLDFSDAELEEHYAEMGYEEGENDYNVTAMRHLLVMAEADENGEYSEEAIAAAHETAESYYEIWKDGERTEESFAELASQYTDDTGSIDNGGLYEEIYKGEMVDGIDEWLFEDGRKAGDTAVIDNNGSYVGTHIVYFVGEGERYSHILALDDLIDTVISEWFTEMTGSYSMEQGAAYDAIGVI